MGQVKQSKSHTTNKEVKVMTKSNQFHSPIKTKGFHKWSFQEVNVNSDKNYLENHNNLNVYCKVLNQEVNMNVQTKELSVVHLVISLIIWLLCPVYVVGSIVVFTLNTIVNYINKEIKLQKQVDQYIEKVKFDSSYNQIKNMFDEIGYENPRERQVNPTS